MSSLRYSPDYVLCSLLKLTDDHYEMIKDNEEIMELIYDGAENAIRKTNMMENGLQEFRTEFMKEANRMCITGGVTLVKRQLLGCLMDVMKEDTKLYSEEDRKLAEAAYANLELTMNKSDPWVNFENKKYRYSRFMMLKRKQCYIIEMPGTGEYLAMDVEKLQNGFDKMEIPLKVKDLASIDENDERMPANCRGREPTELEGLVFKTMCELIIENGEKMKEEKEEKVVELDPKAQAKLDKKKEANHKKREKRKAAKKANKELKAEEMNEKEDFKLEVVNEEAPPAASSV